ncbi:MAG: hypothetical protein QX191_01855 [Methylococcaceae bacterium]
MTYAVFWLFFSIIGGVIAAKKGRSGIGFFFLSILFSPLIGIISAIIATPNQKQIENDKVKLGWEKKCPFCAEIIKKDAVVCHFCKRDLPEVVIKNDAVISSRPTATEGRNPPEYFDKK